MSVADEVLAVRRGAGLFELADRGLLEIAGGDARRWLNGMVSNYVALLREGPERSGCRALVLSNKGRVLAELHVLLVGEAFWLELPRASAEPIAERLGRFVIDDVRIADRSADDARFGVEGPAAGRALEGALGGGPLALADGSCGRRTADGAEVAVARFGWSGEEAYQLFVPEASRESVQARLVEVAVPCSLESLEVLRVEAGRPRWGAELSEDVLPPEARLEGAISYTKGCYTGQEIVARLRSRGHVNHILVGLRFDGAAPPAPGVRLRAAKAEIGEVTSAVRSPVAGAIGLGFVRVGHDAPGTLLDAGGRTAHVAALPLVPPTGPLP